MMFYPKCGPFYTAFFLRQRARRHAAQLALDVAVAVAFCLLLAMVPD